MRPVNSLTTVGFPTPSVQRGQQRGPPVPPDGPESRRTSSEMAVELDDEAGRIYQETSRPKDN